MSTLISPFVYVLTQTESGDYDIYTTLYGALRAAVMLSRNLLVAWKKAGSSMKLAKPVVFRARKPFFAIS